jgi:hypothetical protein
MPWIYEPSPDRKHKRDWDRPRAGFVIENGEEVGKCPSNLTVEIAESLLNDGDRIEYSPLRWPNSYPDRIYHIHGGQLYRAAPTVPGHSYHGFPESPAKALKLPREVKLRILALARIRQCEGEVSRCLKGKS